MFSQKDIAVLRGLFAEQEHRLNSQWDIRFSDFKHEIRDEMHSVVNAAVFASEQRMMKRMNESEERLTKKIDALQDGILDIINDGILPQIEENRIEILGVKRRLTLLE